MHESFIKYNSMNMGNVQLCYATGKESKRNDYKFDSLILVVWASGGNFIPNPTNNEFDECS